MDSDTLTANDIFNEAPIARDFYFDLKEILFQTAKLKLTMRPFMDSNARKRLEYLYRKLDRLKKSLWSMEPLFYDSDSQDSKELKAIVKTLIDLYDFLEAIETEETALLMEDIERLSMELSRYNAIGG